ncbi:MAG: DUF2281 domain-containing protein [Nitrococcus sp.]|nr:DUF2281 domain-containing protein [Nitrococcus sp.]
MHAYDKQGLVDKLQELPPECIAEVEDFIDFLRQRRRRLAVGKPSEERIFPTISVGEWPQGLSLHREKLYGDDGR